MKTCVIRSRQPALDQVGQRAGRHADEHDRQVARRLHERDHRRRGVELHHQPRRAHRLHPGADVGRQQRDPEVAVDAILEGRPGGHALSLPHGQDRHPVRRRQLLPAPPTARPPRPAPRCTGSTGRSRRDRRCSSPRSPGAGRRPRARPARCPGCGRARPQSSHVGWAGRDAGSRSSTRNTREAVPVTAVAARRDGFVGDPVKHPEDDADVFDGSTRSAGCSRRPPPTRFAPSAARDADRRSRRPRP